MATGSVGSDSAKFTEADVIEFVAGALNVPAAMLTSETTASDIEEWDSMGYMGILVALDQAGVECDLGNTEALQSLRGILDLFRAAEKLV